MRAGVAASTVRRAIARLGVLLVAGSGLVLASGVPAHACSCINASTAASVKGADAVFVGTVDELVQGTRYTHRVPVSSVYQGQVPPVVTVNTAEEGGHGSLSSCHFELTRGEELVFFAHGSGDAYGTGLCDFSRPPTDKLLREVAALTTTAPIVYSAAQVGGDDVEDLLTADSPPAAESPATGQSDGPGGRQVAVLGVLALAAAAVVVVLSRRARRVQ